MKKIFIISGVAILLIGAVLFIVTRNPSNPITQETVEKYISDHKDRLIPIDPVLGGSWYITGVDYNALTKSGTFSYEDGHIDGSAAFEIRSKGRNWGIALSDYITLDSGNDLRKMQSQTGAVKGVLITLHEIVGDYRCPVDAQCIEGGGVTVRVTLSSSDDQVIRNIASDEVPFTFSGHKISIANIRPPALSGKTIASDEYQITFRVE